jgi:hypothetical protein
MLLKYGEHYLTVDESKLALTDEEADIWEVNYTSPTYGYIYTKLPNEDIIYLYRSMLGKDWRETNYIKVIGDMHDNVFCLFTVIKYQPLAFWFNIADLRKGFIPKPTKRERNLYGCRKEDSKFLELEPANYVLK